MASLRDIGSSWYKYLTATPELRKQIRARLDICDTCSNKMQINPVTGVLMKIVGNNPDNHFQCGLCHCPLDAMAAGPASNCKAGKWLP